MTIIWPLAIISLISLVAAVFAGIKAVQDKDMAQHPWVWLAILGLVLISLASGLVSWWAWRFTQEFDF